MVGLKITHLQANCRMSVVQCPLILLFNLLLIFLVQYLWLHEFSAVMKYHIPHFASWEEEEKGKGRFHLYPLVSCSECYSLC